MKLIIASDIHGSATYASRLFDLIEAEQPDRIALLGDLLYHGPRNDLPQGYDTQRVASLLNTKAEHIIAVRGNCDAEVDQMMLDFPCMADYTTIADGEFTLFCTHGHIFSPPTDHTAPDTIPALPSHSAFLSGHTHIKTLVEHGDILYVNPGSVSLPKDGSRSFAVYESGTFTLKSLDDGSSIETYVL